jgi:RNA polymerase primary sigma factor
MRQLVISKSITQREYKSLDKYFNEVDKIDLITSQEEVMLAQKIRAGDGAALERLTKTNLRFVISVAKQYQNQGLTLGDLINEGNMGLIIAAKRFDETKGFKFISYAVWWIRQSIIIAIAEHARIVRVPYNQLTLLSKLYKVYSKLEQDQGRKPTNEELAQGLGISAKKIYHLMNKSGVANVSIDEPFGYEEGHSLLEVMRNDEPDPDDTIMYEAIKQEIQLALSVLNQRDRELLILFFGLGSNSPLSLEEIGKRFNITKEHVGRLKEKALSKLRSCSNASVLMSCLS